MFSSQNEQENYFSLLEYASTNELLLLYNALKEPLRNPDFRKIIGKDSKYPIAMYFGDIIPGWRVLFNQISSWYLKRGNQRLQLLDTFEKYLNDKIKEHQQYKQMIKELKQEKRENLF